MEVNDLENLMFSSPPPSLEGVNAKFARNIRYGDHSPELWIDNTHVSQAIPFNASIASHHPYHARALVDHYRRYGAKVTAFYGDPVLHVDRNKESLVKFIWRTLAA